MPAGPGSKERSLKRTSVLRRAGPEPLTAIHERYGVEGDVCAFEVAPNAAAALVEDPAGRYMMLLSGDRFLATPGYRESTRWVVGGPPSQGLVPGGNYWVLADSGVMGELISDSPRGKEHLVEARFLGVATRTDGVSLNIAQFAIQAAPEQADHGAPLFLVLGTSSEVGKTTAAVAIIRTLRQSGVATVTAAKMTGTSAFNEIAKYRDFGATAAFDCVDFGLPTTYNPATAMMRSWFDRAIGFLLSQPSGAIVMECGGDIFGANVPGFLDSLKARRAAFRTVLVAPDALAAAGAKRVLEDTGVSVSLLTGACTDTTTLRDRTRQFCGLPAVNMMGHDKIDAATLSGG